MIDYLIPLFFVTGKECPLLSSLLVADRNFTCVLCTGITRLEGTQSENSLLEEEKEMSQSILELEGLAMPLRTNTQLFETITVRILHIVEHYPFLSDLDKGTPKNPIVLAHGLLGFNELRLAGKYLPAVHYWRGITDVLAANGIEVITAHVPASASIEERAARLSEDIFNKAKGKSVNIIAYVVTYPVFLSAH